MPTLEWIGKNKVVNHHQEVPFRVLERQYSFDEQGQHIENNGSENMIIHGDNLEALKALLPQYEGKVKCINESAKLFERITDPALTVRRITLNANKVTPDEGIYQVDFFTDTKKLEKEKKLQQAMLGIKNKYGKNAVLKASSYEEGATMRQRNAQIGGHSAGGSDGKLQK